MRQHDPELRVLVVAYGDPEHLRQCLSSLGAPPGTVVVVDNGLSYQACAIVTEAGAEYVAPPRNLGFAGGVNLGLGKLARDADVLLLNPDAELTWAAALRLQATLRADAGLAAVAPQLRRPDGSSEPSSWPVPSPRQVWGDALGLSSRMSGLRFLTGAVLLVRAEAVASVGRFDEDFFLYAEEADWQYRALRAGWRVAVVDDVVALHLGGATSDSSHVRSEHFYRSARHFAQKWYGSRGAAAMRAGSVVAGARRAATSRGPRRIEAVRALREQLRRHA